MNIEESAVFLLAKVSVAHKNMLERRMGEIGLHSGQVFILLALWEQDGLRQIDLADTLNLSAPTINKMLKGMVDTGLVSRSRFEGDRRSTRLFLTDAGRQMKPHVEEQWRQLELRVTADMTETERLILPQLLVKLLENYLNK